jgi:hypothetical protein
MLPPLFMCFFLPLETIIPATFVIAVTKPLTKLLIHILCHRSGQATVDGQISRLPTSSSSIP